MKYGLVSVYTSPREASIARVCVDGEEVTPRCITADDLRGSVECYARDANGRFYVEHGEVVRETLYGDVVIDFPYGLD